MQPRGLTEMAIALRDFPYPDGAGLGCLNGPNSLGISGRHLADARQALAKMAIKKRMAIAIRPC